MIDRVEFIETRQLDLIDPEEDRGELEPEEPKKANLGSTTERGDHIFDFELTSLQSLIEKLNVISTSTLGKILFKFHALFPVIILSLSSFSLCQSLIFIYSSIVKS